jgi:very-short-patch-repair endonuclease
MSKEEQFLLATNMQKHYEINIIKNEVEPYTLYCMKDLEKILDMANIRKLICNSRDKVKIKTKTNGGNQYMSYLTYSGLINYLSKIRKTTIIDFSNKIGIDINRQIHLSIEADTLKCIMDAFRNEQYEEQHSVGKYRIDLFFPRYKLAIECDENHHNNTINQENDIKRETEIKSLINDCHFIRYKPFANDFNIFLVINDIYTYIKYHIEYEKEMLELQIKLKEVELKYMDSEKKYIKILEETKQIEAEIRKKELDMKSQENDSEMINKLSEITEKIKTEPIEEKQVEVHNEIEVLKNTFVKRRLHSRSPKVFQFDKDTLELVTIYDSVIDVIRNFDGTSHSALREAAKANTIYKNYRWVLQDRDIADIPKPQPTVLSSNKSIEYIAMIDVKQTKIMEVFASQRDAAQSRNLAGFSTISRAIKNGSMSSGHYWKLFDKCSQEMQDEYLLKNSLPERFIKKNSRFVIQIDPITNKEIKRFGSITDVTLKFQMSHITLKKVSDTNEIHNGYKWKIAE